MAVKKIRQGDAPDITDNYEEALDTGRIRQKYKFPDSVRLHPEVDPSSILISELSSAEVEDSARASTGSNVRLSSEMAKRAIRGVDGKTVSYETVETLWPKWSVKIQVLIKQATNKLHSTSDEEDEAFFSSAETI